VAENCTGSSALCPTDAFEPQTQVCRPSAGACDIPESCTGSGSQCPADAVKVHGFVCQQGQVCQPTSICDGSTATCSVTYLSNSSVCRAAVGECDIPEYCTGSTGTCPADQHDATGTPCDDGQVCTDGDACTSTGVCLGNTVQCATDGYCTTNGSCACNNVNATYPECDCIKDACGVCNGNNSCIGCNGIPDAKLDKCGVCQGDGSSCSASKGSVSIAAIAGAIGGGTGMAAAFGFYKMAKRRQASANILDWNIDLSALAVSDNPLYTELAQNFDNPLFEEVEN